ncbi:MAG: FecR domain-containing protein, partial [Polyangiaceae bacterium]
MVPLPPEVEPLGDVRWARIEQSLMQRLEEIPAAETKPADVRAKSRSRVWPVTLVATFAVSAAAAVTLHVARPSIHASTSRVVTEASPSHVTIAENSIDVSPESGIVVTEEEHATVLTLERGEVSLHVAPREKDRPFLVEAGDVHVRVVGTEFTVRRVGIGATVAVRHGVVEVREHGELALVKGGERWPADAKDVAPAANAGATDSVGSGGGATGGALDAPIAPRSPHPPGPPPRRQGVGNVNRSASVDES